MKRCKHLCGPLTIDEELPHLIPRDKFLDNLQNKANLVKKIGAKLQERGVSVVYCRDDADTAIVKKALEYAEDGPVEVSKIISTISK